MAGPSSSVSREEVRSNGIEEPAAVLTSSGSKEEVKPNEIKERAAEPASSGSKVAVMRNEIEEPAAELASSGSKVEVMPKEITEESGSSLANLVCIHILQKAQHFYHYFWDLFLNLVLFTSRNLYSSSQMWKVGYTEGVIIWLCHLYSPPPASADNASNNALFCDRN